MLTADGKESRFGLYIFSFCKISRIKWGVEVVFLSYYIRKQVQLGAVARAEIKTFWFRNTAAVAMTPLSQKFKLQI